MNPFSALSDEKLMEEYNKGNNMAFEVLYTRHESRVYSYLRSRVSDKSSVDEIFQNIFLKVHKFRDKYDPKFLFLKWLYTISRSELADYFKYKKGSFEQFDENNFLIEDVDSADPKIDIENIKYLNEKEKRALHMRYYSDNDFEEISLSLGVSPSNSRKIISRGLKKLRTRLVGGKND